MSGWQLTVGLQNLRRQVDAVFPDRDKTSDGTIGDTAHQAGSSGHNPDDTPGSRPAWEGDSDNLPEVRAWDMDNNLAPGFDAQVLVDHIRQLPGVSSVIRYMIYNRRMYHERAGFAPTPYTGASPHTEHVHFEGAWSQAADNDKSFNYRLEEIPVALTDADKKWLTALNTGDLRRYPDGVERANTLALQETASTILFGTTVGGGVTFLGKQFATLAKLVDQLAAAIPAEKARDAAVATALAELRASVAGLPALTRAEFGDDGPQGAAVEAAVERALGRLRLAVDPA